MADKDSWWQDDATNSGEDDSFGTRTTQNDASSFNPRSVNEGFEPKLETCEKKNKGSNTP